MLSETVIAGFLEVAAKGKVGTGFIDHGVGADAHTLMKRLFALLVLPVA